MATQNERRATFGGSLSHNAFSGLCSFSPTTLYTGSTVSSFGFYEISVWVNVCVSVSICVFVLIYLLAFFFQFALSYSDLVFYAM